MSALTVVQPELPDLVDSCLSGLSAHSRRCYRPRIDRFRSWLVTTGRRLSRDSVTSWLDYEASGGASGQSLNQSLAAVKRLASEAAENGWLDWGVHAQITAIKARRRLGIRTGNWLSITELRRLLEAPDRTTPAGRRDAAALALLAGCGLRRSEACSLTVGHLTVRDGVMTIVNLKGKGNRVRTVAVPVWAAGLITAWLQSAGITDGRVLRRL